MSVLDIFKKLESERAPEPHGAHDDSIPGYGYIS